jgi:hypothetical protein
VRRARIATKTTLAGGLFDKMAGQSDVTTKRPTFRWDHTLRTNEGYRICINLSSNAACSIGGTIAANIAGHTNSWTPAQDLPYNRGDVVYFRIGACNTNDCKWTLSSFRFMP